MRSLREFGDLLAMAGKSACASALAFRAAGNLACGRPFRPPLGFALLWGSQSWLQPAFSRLARPLTNFSGFPSRYLQDITPKKRCDRQCSGFASRLKGGCRHDCLPHCAP